MLQRAFPRIGELPLSRADRGLDAPAQQRQLVRLMMLAGGGVDYNNYLKGLAPNLIGLWPFTDASGNALDISGNGFNGTYDVDAVKSGDTFALGTPIVSLLGNGAVGLPVASLETLLSWEEYSVILWFKMPIAKWSDTTSYTQLFLGSTGTTQRIHFRKNTIPGEFTILADTGVSLLSVAEESIITPDWFQVAVTNSKIANEMKGYLNNNQILPTKTGVGTDDGSALVTAAVGAADATGTSGITGAVGYLALYHDTILTQTQIQSSYNYVASRYNSGTKYIIGSGDSTWAGEGVTTSKLITNLGAGWGFVREMAIVGLTSTQWKTGNGSTWLGIDGELARTSFNRDPFAIITDIGKNDMSAMPSQATFEANISYVFDAFHVKWPTSKIVIESPWRTGKTAESTLIKGYINNVIATRSWATIGTDETGYFATAEGATPGSYSSDGTHIDTAAGTTARAGLLATAIAAL